MDKSTEEKLRQIESEVDAARSSLDRIQSLEYQRRKDVVSAVISFAQPNFSKLKELRSNYQTRRYSEGSGKTLWWFLSVSTVGVLWQYFFTDSSKTWDWTFGSFLVVAALVWLLKVKYQTYEVWRDLREQENYCNELLYRWIANGCSDSLFWRLRDMIVEHGDRYVETEANSRWWFKLEAELLNRITGERKLRTYDW